MTDFRDADDEETALSQPDLSLLPDSLRHGSLPDHSLPNREAEEILWDATGRLYGLAVGEIGEDMAASVMLSRLARELRLAHGIKDAESVFRWFAASMRGAARRDRWRA